MFSKITISNKMISLICILSILLSIFANVIMLSTVAVESDVANGNVLFESDYSSAVVREDSSALRKTGGDVYPIDVSSNKVLSYTPSWYCAGQVVLGSDYAGGNDYIQGQALTAEAGKTYEVEFDYYLKGSSGVPAVRFGLAIGSVGNNHTDNPIYSYNEQKVTFASNTNIETGNWVTDYKITYTVPVDADFTNGDKLLLYFQDGSTGGTTQIYIDNVKVIETVESPEGTLFSSGYDNANWDEDAVYNSYVGGPIATADPLNSSNKVMMKANGSPSAFVLGMNYYAESVTSPNCYSLVDEEAVKVEAGKTYVVKLDYYYDFSESGSANPLLLTTGKLSEKSGSSGTISYDNTIAKTVFEPEAYTKSESWTKGAEIEITIPENYEISDYPYLVLYTVAESKRQKYYIDNVSVVLKSGETEESELPEGTLFSSGYDNANWDEDAVYNSYVGGPIATADPLNSSNKVMMKANGSPSAFVLGMNYYAESVTSPNCYSLVDEEAVKVEAGKTYVVKLDYYYDFSESGSANPLLLTTGKLSEKSGSSGTISYDNTIAKTVFEPEAYTKSESWTKGAEIEITIPENYEISDYPYLVLYTVAESKRQKYYIDNVSVALKSGETEESKQPTEDLTEDQVIFESDYSTATKVKGLTGDDLWNAINSHKKSSLAVFPYANPFDSNDISLVRHGENNFGAVYLGADYVTPSEIKNQAIKVIPGVSYRVQFDYYAHVVTEGQLPTNPLKIYLAAGNTVATSGWPGYETVHESNSRVEVVSFEANKDYGMTTWKTETVDITIPADLDTETYPYLILDVKLGTIKGRVYFDDVKVTRLAGKIEISSNNGYDNAVIQKNSQSSIFKNVSGDFYPAIDPLSSNNKVMKYSQGTNNRSMLFIGASYSNANDIPYETVTAIAGQTYTLTFDYYIEGTVSHEDGLQIGVGVGTTKYVAPNGSVSGYNQTISIDKGSGNMSGWIKGYTVTYTVPVGSTLKNGNKLFIYAQNGRGANLYIDNVKVEKSEEIITGDGDGTYRINFETNGGKPLPSIDFNLVTNNVVLGYRPNYYGAGQLLFGTDYVDNNTVMNSSLSVQKGATYEIQFDYYAKGTISSNDFKFGIAIGAASGHKTANPLYSYTEEKITYSGGQQISTEGWIKGNRYIFKVPSNLDLGAGDKLMFYFANGQTGQFNFYIDNVKVTRLDGQNKVLFESNYNETTPRTDLYWTSYRDSSGDVFPKPDPLGGVASLPVPEHDTGIFVEWCVDKELLNPVNVNSFYGTKVITLYAKWRFYDPEITINIDDCTSYWTPEGKRDDKRMAKPITITKEGNNAVLKYNMKYAKEQIIDYDKSQGSTTCFDGYVIGLFDPTVFANDPVATPEDAAYLVKQGGTYYVQFKYKALSVDPDSTVSTRLYFQLGVTSENSTTAGIKKMVTLNHSSNTADSEWKMAGGILTIDDISSSGNRLSIFCYGYGEVLIDDITIVAVNDGLAFETYGGTPTKPVYGNVGDAIEMPNNPTRDDSKFLGWYLDEEFTKPHDAATKISEGVTKLYAKFLTYQTVQSFEDYQRGKNRSIQHYYYVNRLTDDNPTVANRNWLGSKFQADKVRTGKASIVAWGETQYESIATFFDSNIPLTVGEEYTISFWVNLEEMMLPADIQLVFTYDMNNLVDPEWDVSKYGTRYDSIISTAYLENHKNEWCEIRYDFKAKAPYVGVSIPGLTKVWIDDAVITLTSADASYKRSIDGPGITYEELTNISFEDDATESNKIIIKPAIADEIDSDENSILTIVIISVSAIVIVAAAIVAFIFIRKRKIVK